MKYVTVTDGNYTSDGGFNKGFKNAKDFFANGGILEAAKGYNGNRSSGSLFIHDVTGPDIPTLVKFVCDGIVVTVSTEADLEQMKAQFEAAQLLGESAIGPDVDLDLLARADERRREIEEAEQAQKQREGDAHAKLFSGSSFAMTFRSALDMVKMMKNLDQGGWLETSMRLAVWMETQLKEGKPPAEVFSEGILLFSLDSGKRWGSPIAMMQNIGVIPFLTECWDEGDRFTKWLATQEAVETAKAA